MTMYFVKQCFSGRAIWKKWSGYQRRSLVETKMHYINSLSKNLAQGTFEVR
jgi:hypothetical protein